MKFAINYSPQVAELIQEGLIDIDLFKCADWPELVEPASAIKPVYVHFPLQAGRPHQSEPDWEGIQRWRDTTDTRIVNVHLSATDTDFPDILRTSSDPKHAERVIEQMAKDIKVIGEHFGMENVIAENVPTDFVGTKPLPLRVAVEPSTIRAVMEQTGCGLLLDIDHARVAAHALGMNHEEYITQLPTDRIRELHMTGTHLIDGIFQSHLPMKDDDWEIFDWALGQIKSGTWSHPNIYAFEYGGIGKEFEWRSDKKVIAEQVPELQRRMQKYGLKQ